MKLATTLALALLVGSSLLAAQSAQAQRKDRTGPGDFKVVLLGVGTPVPLKFRFGPATLVIAGGKYLLFDAGRGVGLQLWAKRVPLGRIDRIFLTHLHSDHLTGIPDLLLTGRLRSPFANRKGPLKITGPKGTAAFAAHLVKAFAADIAIRQADQKIPAAWAQIEVKEITTGLVYDEAGVRVTAIAVNHGAKIKPTVGYRIAYGGRSVVISGDTKFSKNLMQKAKGADLFIHAVAAARPALLKTAKFWQNILDHHTSPEDVGRIFAGAKPRLAVFYHLVTLTNGKIKPPFPKDLVRRARTTYQGPLVVGKDLMIIRVGKDKVEVSK